MDTFEKVGLSLRSVMYDIIKALYGRSYMLIEVKTDILQEKIKLYTHYEGLQVIDELLLLGEYAKVFELKPKTVIDIGAHIGVFTVTIGKYIETTHKKGLILAVEPMSINYIPLLANISINKLHNVIPIKAAVAPTEGTATLSWIGVKEQVKTITMSHLLNLANSMRRKEIDVVKLDIEGAELEILRESADWLKHVKAVVMELHPVTYGYKGVKEIISILSRNGFIVDYISKEIDTRRALQKWLYYINPNPPWLILALWKTLVTIFRDNIRINYLFAKKIQ
jgi:FkbM family methyltransferase